jgi:hypothetical protein
MVKAAPWAISTEKYSKSYFSNISDLSSAARLRRYSILCKKKKIVEEIMFVQTV